MAEGGPGLEKGAAQEQMAEKFAKVQKQYYDSLIVEMKEDCETYKKATECHEYAKLLIEKVGKVKQGFEQYKKNCMEYGAGASCHNAANLLLRGAALPDGTVPVERDVPSAAQFFAQACSTNYGRSCVPVARLLQLGQLLPKDYEKAFEYLTMGCNKHNNDSCFAKATCYIQGMGVGQDYKEAVPLLKKGCDQGHSRSCHNLAVLYYHGHGVAKDLDKFKLYNEKSKIFRGEKNPFTDPPKHQEKNAPVQH